MSYVIVLSQTLNNSMFQHFKPRSWKTITSTLALLGPTYEPLKHFWNDDYDDRSSTDVS